MTERYPEDAVLLALTTDAATGVEYIPTGKSPYYLEFRRLVQRLLLAGQRANDLRVFPDGDLTIGVRPGRCFINNGVVDYAGAQAIGISANATTDVWLDAGGIHTGTAGLPGDRTGFIPLAQVTTGAAAITAITDRRGEAFLLTPSLASLGLSAPAGNINRALDGAGNSVTAAALNTLTTGNASNADSLHTHDAFWKNANNETYFYFGNNANGGNANVALVWTLPNVLADDPALLPNLRNGFLTQRYLGTAYNLVGTVHAQYGYGGALSASATGRLMGVVPIDGVVVNVILSVGANIQSSVAADNIQATAKVQGTALTSTPPQITSAAGAGFRSTAQGHGTAAVVKTDGAQNVKRGDVLTVDLMRTAVGTISTEATDVVVLVVIRAAQPE